MPSTLLRVFISLAVIESAAGLLTMLTSPLVLGFNGALQRRVEFPSTLKVINIYPPMLRQAYKRAFSVSLASQLPCL